MLTDKSFQEIMLLITGFTTGALLKDLGLFVIVPVILSMLIVSFVFGTLNTIQEGKQNGNKE